MSSRSLSEKSLPDIQVMIESEEEEKVDTSKSQNLSDEASESEDKVRQSDQESKRRSKHNDWNRYGDDPRVDYDKLMKKVNECLQMFYTMMNEKA
jgi:hypothetical protein